MRPLIPQRLLSLNWRMKLLYFPELIKSRFFVCFLVSQIRKRSLSETIMWRKKSQVLFGHLLWWEHPWKKVMTVLVEPFSFSIKYKVIQKHIYIYILPYVKNYFITACLSHMIKNVVKVVLINKSCKDLLKLIFKNVCVTK